MFSYLVAAKCILCNSVQFVREVQYSASKVAIIFLSALVARKVMGGEIIG